MTDSDIEKFIEDLDKASEDLCVYPEKQTFDCCDCYVQRTVEGHLIWVKNNIQN